jgi:hypothetical protein
MQVPGQHALRGQRFEIEKVSAAREGRGGERVFPKEAISFSPMGKSFPNKAAILSCLAL